MENIKKQISEVVEKKLQEIHAEQYIGLDDEMPDDYEAWLQENIIDNPENEDIASLIN